MFELATGLSFARKHNALLSYRTLPGVVPRISEFKAAQKIKIVESTPCDTSKSLASKAFRKLNLVKQGGNTYNEVGLNYQELHYDESRNFHGYFQSWRYFHSMRNQLISEFELIEPSSLFLELKRSFPKTFTGIHIRRGGSGAAILTSDYHGLLDVEYYKRAIDLNIKLGGSTDYIVFTDNPEKSQKTVDALGLGNIRILGPMDTHSQCENLLLMSEATSFIGANSSYSWWAAYLNQKLVTQPIFPRQWYMNPDQSNNDMLLPDWISVGFEKFLNEKVTRGINLE